MVCMVLVVFVYCIDITDFFGLVSRFTYSLPVREPVLLMYFFFCKKPDGMFKYTRKLFKRRKVVEYVVQLKKKTIFRMILYIELTTWCIFDLFSNMLTTPIITIFR